MQSALEAALNPPNDTESVKKEDMLRSGDYWNSVWVEEVNPKNVLRTYQNKHSNQDKKYRSSVPKLGSVRAKIMPGSKLYQLVSVLRQFSPRLLYVINTNK
ncbi:uncharacterized protein LOC114363257 [Ostrinia furnacalis]|uniref:uncharacterized protein LOC114363257 n=1 Tax=Ostrinia furnacalis TaxID=93504 RepID=UPI00103B6454|nr:uncharacterized protein LOC114363257 [Ostrinia furnacalis]